MKRKDRTGKNPGERICNKCQESKVIKEFAKCSSRWDGLAVQCKECLRGNSRDWQKRNNDRIWKKVKTWRQMNPQRKKIQGQEWRLRRRLMLIEHYGGKCACCGQWRFEFLAIDHINGGGTQHRETVGRGGRFYQWLISQGFPEGYRVLCHNCNLAIGFYGYCPHQSGQLSDELVTSIANDSGES